MNNAYLWLKLAHVLIAVLALGTGACLALVLDLYGDHSTHGAFVLRAVRTLTYFVVIPGYLLMLGTGMWMGALAALLDAHWAESAMNLWGVGALLLAASQVMLHKRIRLLESGERASPRYSRTAALGRLAGGGVGLVILAIVYFMVMKPS